MTSYSYDVIEDVYAGTRRPAQITMAPDDPYTRWSCVQPLLLRLPIVALSHRLYRLVVHLFGDDD